MLLNGNLVQSARAQILYPHIFVNERVWSGDSIRKCTLGGCGMLDFDLPVTRAIASGA